ncbi:MAG TPA: TIGR02266 family protein [Nitrospiria bacterium]|nr:TIGR02266 family protein [Nitrospiria bacterium]
MATIPKVPPPEKRRYPRAPISIRIQYHQPQKGIQEGFTAIMGGGGLFIDTVSPLPIGTPVHLEFGLPGQVGAVRVDGQVAWVRSDFDPKGFSPGMGIQFRKINESDREKIVQFVMRVLLGQSESHP